MRPEKTTESSQHFWTFLKKKKNTRIIKEVIEGTVLLNKGTR